MDKLWGAVACVDAGQGRASTIWWAAAPRSWRASRQEFRAVIERDYAKYGKLSDLFKTVK